MERLNINMSAKCTALGLLITILAINPCWAQNFGIGTNSPGSKLHVIQTDTFNAFQVDDEASDATPFVIDKSGNVGIGTTNPSSKLEVNGAISGFGIVPIGSIIAWHKSFSNSPALPDGWVECDGQVLSDPNSV